MGWAACKSIVECAENWCHNKRQWLNSPALSIFRRGSSVPCKPQSLPKNCSKAGRLAIAEGMAELKAFSSISNIADGINKNKLLVVGSLCYREKRNFTYSNWSGPAEMHRRLKRLHISLRRNWRTPSFSNFQSQSGFHLNWSYSFDQTKGILVSSVVQGLCWNLLLPWRISFVRGQGLRCLL